MNARIRPFESGDVEATVALINLCNATDDLAARTSTRFLYEHDCRGNPTGCPFLVAEHDGQIVGFAELNQEDGTRLIAMHWVQPAWRASDLGRQLLEHQMRQALSFPEPCLDVPVRARESAKLALVGGLGFELVRTWWRVRKDLTYPPRVPAPCIPAGFAFRSFVAGQDERELTALMNDVFAEHWGEGLHTLEEVCHDLSLSWFDPTLLIFAEMGGQKAGYVWSWVSPGAISGTVDPCAYLGDLGVIRAHRGHGLGRALLLHALNDLQARGQVAVDLEVDDPNADARHLYRSVGFYDKEELRWFRWVKS